ncbi:hypothetical protein [Tenacibaculum sp. 190524A02b]|uniref:hypothetical protein n=1 Tax=Tenacibaculum vairaonense TaxID=3137860 RepID=UPI0031FA82D1
MNKNSINSTEKAINTFVKQGYLTKQCGQACLSMVTREPKEMIVKNLDKEYYTGIHDDLQKYLDERNYKTLLAVGNFQMEEVPNNSIVRLKKPDNTGHFILKDENGLLLDPNVGIVKLYLNDYKVSHYLKFEKIE